MAAENTFEKRKAYRFKAGDMVKVPFRENKITPILAVGEKVFRFKAKKSDEPIVLIRYADNSAGVIQPATGSAEAVNGSRRYIELSGRGDLDQEEMDAGQGPFVEIKFPYDWDKEHVMVMPMSELEAAGESADVDVPAAKNENFD